MSAHLGATGGSGKGRRLERERGGGRQGSRGSREGVHSWWGRGGEVEEGVAGSGVKVEPRGVASAVGQQGQGGAGKGGVRSGGGVEWGRGGSWGLGGAGRGGGHGGMARLRGSGEGGFRSGGGRELGRGRCHKRPIEVERG